MAVEGDLKDIDITSVIQVMCTERRRAGLVMRRRGEEGVIFLDNGEIVHAILGPLQGEDAVYELLTWRDGSFRMTDQVRTPTRSIGMPWSHILMEGMRKLDEGRREEPSLELTSAGVEVMSVADREGDDALESQLMLLLSQLEQAMARLSLGKLKKRPQLALDHLCEMVNQLVAFAEERTGAHEGAVALEAILHRAGRKLTLARLLSARGNRLSVETPANLYRTWSRDPADRRKTFREIGRAMALLVQSYFDLLARQFRSPATADAWRESYGVFLRDLALAIDRIPF
jgi:hypothetical protein